MGWTWQAGQPGLMVLPSGRLVRGRGLHGPVPVGEPPTFGVYLLGRPPPEQPWPSRWVRWPDFRLPADPAELRRVLVEALSRVDTDRVEFGCAGGRGRTGTALAALAVLDGCPADQAVAYVRAHYRPDAVETPRQGRFIAAFR